MTVKRFRVNDLVKYNYSEIGEYIDENHTDRPLMNNEVCELLNELHEEKEYWKGNACDNWNFVNILFNELDIAQEKGYEVSDSFKKLIEKKS